MADCVLLGQSISARAAERAFGNMAVAFKLAAQTRAFSSLREWLSFFFSLPNFSKLTWKPRRIGLSD